MWGKGEEGEVKEKSGYFEGITVAYLFCLVACNGISSFISQSTWHYATKDLTADTKHLAMLLFDSDFDLLYGKTFVGLVKQNNQWQQVKKITLKLDLLTQCQS